MASALKRQRIGFACHWDDPAPPTWSYTPWHLRAAMQAQAEVVDLGVQLPSVARTGLKAVHARRRAGGWTSAWRQSALTDVVVGRTLRAAQERCDVVLQIQDLALFDRPHHVYQDLSYDLLVAMSDNRGVQEQFAALTPSVIARRRARQHEVYASASTVMAMSQWFARSLVDDTGLDPARVVVVNPGANAGPTDIEAGDVADGPWEPTGARVLIVGRDFLRKGGDLVVDAVTSLRRTYSRDVQLTVVGPPTWPLPGEPPPGVTFMGTQDVTTVGQLFASHDVYAMPSRFEGFGISLAEALSWGMPCVARDAFAMPELVTDGVNGALVPPDATADDVAGAIVQVLDDHDLRQATRRAATSAARHYRWERAARQMVETMLGDCTDAG